MSPPCQRCPPPIEEPDISIKLLQLNVVSEAMTRLGWSPGHAPLIGAIELVFAGLYLWRPTALHRARRRRYRGRLTSAGNSQSEREQQPVLGGNHREMNHGAFPGR